MSDTATSTETVGLEDLADECSVHPDFVLRLVALGLVDPIDENADEPTFARDCAARIAQIQRLHDGLSLNYTAVGVVLDLLERIDELEARIAELEQQTDV